MGVCQHSPALQVVHFIFTQLIVPFSIITIIIITIIIFITIPFFVRCPHWAPGAGACHSRCARCQRSSPGG